MDTIELNALIVAIPLPAFLVTAEDRIAVPNSGAGDALGAGIEGLHYVAALRQPGILEAIEKARAGMATARGAFVISQAGSERRFAVSASPVTLEGAVSVLVCLEETTGSHDADQMRREFVANVSHELRTPLTALMGFIDTLQGSARDDPTARERFLGVMSREARRMNRLVDDLLSLSRVEYSQRQRPSDRLQAGDLIAAVANTLEGLAGAKRVQFRCEEAAEMAEIQGDTDQLCQVIGNLIENAQKYGGPEEEVFVTVSEVAYDPLLPGPALRFEVRDRGDGIASHHLPRLTERFYRVDEHRSREMGGTGLGLAIVKHIVQRHRGRLDIDSVVGEGSSFSVVLPLGQD